MPAAVLGPVIAAGVAGGTSLAAAKMQSGAASRAARDSTAAANYAADRQAASTREALDFQRQMAQQAFREAETARRANYDQWAARERRLGSIGELLGYGSRGIPEYVGGVDPQFDAPPPMERPPVPGGRFPPRIGSVDSYLRPNIHPGVVMPGPQRGGSVGELVSSPAMPIPVGSKVTQAAEAEPGWAGLRERPAWMDEDTWRRLSSEAQGYGWGGRRPGQPYNRRIVGPVGSYLG